MSAGLAASMDADTVDAIARALIANAASYTAPRPAPTYSAAPCVLECHRGAAVGGEWHLVLRFDLARADEYHYVSTGVERLGLVDCGACFRIREASAGGQVLQTYSQRRGWQIAPQAAP